MAQYTSAQRLLEAVNKLSGSSQDTGDADRACEGAGAISEEFEGVNQSLVDGWAGTKDFLQKLAVHVKENITELAASMAKFSTETIDAEMAAAQASEQANTAAGELMDDLEKNLKATGAATSSTGAESNPGGTAQPDPNQQGTEPADPNQGGTEPADPNQGGTAQPDSNQQGTEPADPNQGGAAQPEPSQGGAEPAEPSQGEQSGSVDPNSLT